MMYCGFVVSVRSVWRILGDSAKMGKKSGILLECVNVLGMLGNVMLLKG